MKYYYYIDKETGEDFLVQAEDLLEAKEILRTYGEYQTAQFQYVMDDMTAELSGLDVY